MAVYSRLKMETEYLFKKIYIFYCLPNCTVSDSEKTFLRSDKRDCRVELPLNSTHSSATVGHVYAACLRALSKQNGASVRNDTMELSCQPSQPTDSDLLHPIHSGLTYFISCTLPSFICSVLLSLLTVIFQGDRRGNWLRHCATSRKVAGSIPDGVTGIFH